MLARVALLFVVLGWVIGCARSEPSAGGGTLPRQAAAETAARERKLVRTAELRLEVDAYAAARARLDEELARVGGYVADARVQHADGAVAFAQLELRVPADALDAFMAALAGLGAVLDEVRRSNEITEEYYDSQARLANARRIEARLLEFADGRTSDVSGLLEVERELGRVRADIESLQARVAHYDSSVAMSAVSVEISSREREGRGVAETLGGHLRGSFQASWRALLGAGRGLLVVLVSLAPWSPMLGLAAYLVRRGAKSKARI